MLARLARVSAVEFAAAAMSGDGVRGTTHFDVAVVYERQIDVAAERERLTKDLAKYEKGLMAAERQLGNDAFIGEGSGAYCGWAEEAGGGDEGFVRQDEGGAGRPACLCEFHVKRVDEKEDSCNEAG